MVGALPPAVRLKLDRTLARWRRWRGGPASKPVATGRPGGGASNVSVVVGATNGRWVVRIDGVDPPRLGLSRDAEWSAMERAAERGLAPRPVYRDPDLGVLVYEYLDADIASDANGDIEAIGGLLRAIHALPPIEYRLDPLDRARRYLGLCGNGTPSRTFVDACRRLSSAPGTAALCHNDPLRANRIPRGGRLLAIDWEYAAMGDPMFDLAAIVEGDGLTEEQARQLLESWLDAPARNRHRERLADNRLVYRELSRLWRAAVES